jgi:hypothetical protein
MWKEKKKYIYACFSKTILLRDMKLIYTIHYFQRQQSLKTVPNILLYLMVMFYITVLPLFGVGSEYWKYAIIGHNHKV